MSIEAMKQALEAMTDFFNAYPHMTKNYTEDAITALRVAIEQAQEPVAWMYTSRWKGDERFTRYQSELSTYKADKVCPLYTAPRQWQGLTDEEIMEPWPCETRLEFARAIEAKLKEKNK